MKAYKFSPYAGGPLSDYSRLYYGDLYPVEITENHDRKNLVIIPDLLSGGDYSNSCTVEKSNHRVFLEQFGKIAGVHDIYGEYNSFGIAIQIDVYENNQEIKECFAALENYPVINDEDIGLLESELFDEYWKDSLQDDFITALVDTLNQDDTGEIDFPLYDDLINNLPNEKIREIFDVAADKSNEYPIFESGCSVYFNIEKIIPAALPLIIAALQPQLDPLYYVKPDAIQLELSI